MKKLLLAVAINEEFKVVKKLLRNKEVVKATIPIIVAKDDGI